MSVPPPTRHLWRIDTATADQVLRQRELAEAAAWSALGLRRGVDIGRALVGMDPTADWMVTDDGRPDRSAEGLAYVAAQGAPISDLITTRVLPWHRLRSQLDGLRAVVRHADPTTGALTPTVSWTVTGRLILSAPALHGLPKIDRTLVKPASGLIISADWSAAELRMAAQMSGDPQLCADLASGADPFERIAGEMGCDRSAAKAGFYAASYGGGDRRVGAVGGGGADWGRRLRAIIDDTWPTLARWRAWKMAEADRTGHVTTITGRRIPVPAAYIAPNYALQGSGVDHLVEVCRSVAADGGGLAVDLSWHDAIYVVADRDDVPSAVSLVESVMTAMPEWWRHRSVPPVATVTVSDSLA